ncbi:hypothetical protein CHINAEXTREME_04375 [Halobiforma lacisalsi AJ5]|uniref:Sulfatase n=1 Tax=Natronobacterium lacisalsi AJ5 TaxID=358396 RepID=M0LRT6_NATLA|nr:hypothetical protein [Halobiforma lacisalsi]APW97052.1 hypothetical protein CHINAEXTREME_04375 [Halobiforma lacisalsi AJ5]EMA34770.1 hypothetical protein C445_07630 [Halobiforma lacisalsi AJ5]
MGFDDWLRVSARKIREKGLEGVGDVAYDLYTGLWWLTWPLPRGTNVYERDWDVLIILDACRVDLLRSVADEYAFLEDAEIERMESVGSMSKEWMAKTFTDEYDDEVANTTYVTSNVFSERILSGDRFGDLDEVWRYGWDDEHDTVPPRPVTDRAIRAARETDPDRLIVHYVQPHHPFLGLDAGFDAEPFGPALSDTVVDALRKDKIDFETFWAAYQDNLRRALEDVELLLENVDADRVAITADHGDALGEWGIYDHPVGCLHPSVRTVPWVTTSATDRETHEPDSDLEKRTADSDVEQRLQALGYVG